MRSAQSVARKAVNSILNSAISFAVTYTQELRGEMERCQPRVMSLKDTADQMVLAAESDDVFDAKEKLHIIANRLKTLLKICLTNMTRIETKLDLTHETDPPVSTCCILNSFHPETRLNQQVSLACCGC